MLDLILDRVAQFIMDWIVDQGKKADWDEIKKDAIEKAREISPDPIDDVVEMVVGLFIDIVANYFQNEVKDPANPTRQEVALACHKAKDLNVLVRAAAKAQPPAAA